MVVITVSGLHGSGRSTQARLLAETFNLRYVSAGQLFRSIARERGVAVHTLSSQLMSDPTIDYMIDERTKREAVKGDVVIEGDLSGFMAGSLADVRIFLKASDEARFKRIAKREGCSIEEAARITSEREDRDRKRFKIFYGVDPFDPSLYHIVLDTSMLTVESTFRILRVCVEEYIRCKGSRGNT
ncbi:MAG: cytidylate kinase family protein [Nitrososphaerota archaeon]|nr:cytidylate kinase family protein [Candidatus Bathyarchaeota archaeon]MCX8162087.1 cytidylate kinase family protein [Candidatus Bathyarchaeota archaeon]MDW8062471.1 cytidylate kinase family protein [Nitrososphaerota archaeon]